MTVSDLKFRDVGPSHCIATWDTAHIYLISGAFTDAMLEALGETLKAFVRESRKSQSVTAVSIIARGAPPPPDHLRKHLADLYRGLPPVVKQVIVLPEGGGFRMAMVRGVCTALAALSPFPFRFSFVSSVQDAADALSRHLSQPTLAPDFERVVETMRAELRKAGNASVAS